MSQYIHINTQKKCCLWRFFQQKLLNLRHFLNQIINTWRIDILCSSFSRFFLVLKISKERFRNFKLVRSRLVFASVAHSLVPPCKKFLINRSGQQKIINQAQIKTRKFEFLLQQICFLCMQQKPHLEFNFLSVLLKS